MAVAGTLGFAARGIGRGARDLDPHHRRDGLGLLTLGVAIVLGASLWGRMDNAVGRAIHAVAVDAFGSLSWVIPVLAVLLAWRFLRHPDRNSETVRASIGWTALLLGVLGMIHIAKGTPHPSDGARAIHLAGGYVGYAVAGPLASALTPWVAAPLLALLAAFGMLVISGTPLHRVPERFAELREMFGHGRPHAGYGDEDGLEIDEDYEARHRRGPPGPRPDRQADQAAPGHRGGGARQAVRHAADRAGRQARQGFRRGLRVAAARTAPTA